MRCINCSSSFIPTSLKCKQKQELKTSKMVYLFKQKHETNIYSHSSFKTKAMDSSSALLLGVTTSPKPDPVVFVVTSAGLFLLFWITNFVVPDIVVKEIESKGNNDDRANENASIENEKAEKLLQRTNMLPEKKGFNSAKPKIKM